MVDGFLALAASSFLSPNTVYESGSTPTQVRRLVIVNETVVNTTSDVAAALTPTLSLTGRGIGNGHGHKNSLTRSIPVPCNSDIGIALMYHEACLKESFA